jgi:hypothetical protein
VGLPSIRSTRYSFDVDVHGGPDRFDPGPVAHGWALEVNASLALFSV